MNVLTLFTLQVLIYAAFPFYLASLPKRIRTGGFYILISIYLVIGGFLGSVYSFPVTDTINISGGNLAYGALMFTAILFVLVEKDVSVLRNTIRLVFWVNIFKVLFFTTVSWALQNQAVLNPNDTAFAVFRTSVFFVILGGALIILELFLFMLIFEQLKKRISNLYGLAFLYLLTFVLVLCLDGILFPMIAFGFNPQIVAIVIGGVKGKLFMAAAYSLPILVFLVVYRRPLTAFTAEPLALRDVWREPRAELVAEIERQQQEIEQSEARFRLAFHTSPDSINITRLSDGLIVEANDAFPAITGYTLEEAIGKKTSDLELWANPADRNIMVAELQQKGFIKDFVFLRKRKDGQIRHTSLSARIIEINGEPHLLSTIRDIHDQKMAQAELEESRRQLVEAQRIARIGSWVFYPRSGQGWWSEELWKLYYQEPRPGMLEMEEYYALVHPDDLAEVQAAQQKVFESGQPVSVMFRTHPSLGPVRYLFGQTEVIHETGEEFYLSGTVQDITERVQAEEVLKESESKLNNAIRIAQLGYWEWDIPNDRVNWSGLIYDIYDVDRDQDITYEVVMSRVHPDDREYHDQHTENWIKNRGGEPYEYRVVRRDGSIRYVRAEGEVLCNKKDEPIKFLGTVQDITERKQADLTIRESEARFRTVMKSSAIIVAICDRELRYTWIQNPHPDFDPQAVLGKRDDELADNEGARQLMALKRQVIESGQVARAEIAFPLSDGELTYDVTAEPLRDEAGNIIGVTTAALDITERKQAEEALRQSEENFRNIYEQSPIAIQLYDQDGKLIDVNPETLRIFGIDDKKHILGFDMWSSAHLTPETTEALRQGNSVFIPGHLDFEMAKKLNLFPTDKSGIIYTDLYVNPLLQAGEITGYLVQFVDVTERKQAEVERDEARQMFQKIFELSPVATTLSSIAQRRVVDVNAATEKLLGYNREEFNGQDILDIDYWADPKERQRVFETLMAEGRVDGYEFSFITKTGQSGQAMIFAEMFEQQGERYALAALVDITELQRYRTHLEEQVAERTADLEREYRRQAALAKIELAINQPFEIQAVLDQIVRVTEQFLPASGGASIALWDPQEARHTISASTVAGQDPHLTARRVRKERGATRWVTDNCKPIVVPDIKDDPFGPNPMLEEFGLRAYAGVPVIIDGQAAGVLYALDRQPREFSSGEIDFMTVIARRAALAISKVRLFATQAETARMLAQRSDELDNRLREVNSLNRALSNLLEDLRAANETLEQKSRQLTEANQELEAFTYSVSHDLRAPLRAVDGFSKILLEDYAAQIPEKAVYYLDKVSQGAQQMGQLIDDLLDLSRMGRKEFIKTRVDPRVIVEQVVEELYSEYDMKRIRVDIGDLPAFQGDRSLMKQVYINLLSNAFKFSARKDEARVEVGWGQFRGSGAYYVRDNGVGFDMQYADKLFGVFQRLHSVDQFEGTGVGLAIVQRIIRRHGGRVWAEAGINEGATFYFTIAEEKEA